MRKQKRPLTTGEKVVLGIAAGVEFSAKVAMWRDLKKRPADQIRGPKWAWVLGSFVNTVGPVAYFGWGRRRHR
jgi:hypothetical protein